MLAALLCGAALATPGPFSDAPLDPAARLIDRMGRAQGADLLYGARGLGTIDMARRMGRLDGDLELLSGVLAPELGGLERPGLQWWGRQGWLGAAGDVQPMLQGGDTEPGLASIRAGGELFARWGSGTVFARPALGVDAAVPTLGAASEEWDIIS